MSNVTALPTSASRGASGAPGGSCRSDDQQRRGRAAPADGGERAEPGLGGVDRSRRGAAGSPPPARRGPAGEITFGGRVDELAGDVGPARDERGARRRRAPSSSPHAADDEALDAGRPARRSPAAGVVAADDARLRRARRTCSSTASGSDASSAHATVPPPRHARTARAAAVRSPSTSGSSATTASGAAAVYTMRDRIGRRPARAPGHRAPTPAPRRATATRSAPAATGSPAVISTCIIVNRHTNRRHHDVGQAEVRDHRALLRGHVLPVSPVALAARRARPRSRLGRRRRLPAVELPLRDVRGRARGRRGRDRARSRRSRSAATTARGSSSTPRRTLRQQTRGASALSASTAVRAPPIAGVLLTDAEIDHTAGLLLLRESATPLRVFGDAGVERALRDGYPVLRMLERYCGVDWRDARAGAGAAARRVEPRGRAVRVRGRRAALCRRAGRRARGERASSSATARPAASSPTSPALASAGRGRARAVRRERPRARRRDVLARRRARRARHLGPQRARHGARAALGPRRDARGARRAGAPAQGARPHQQHQPDPARGLARAGSEVVAAPASKSPTMASRPSFVDADEFVARLRAQGDALPQPAPVPRADGRRRAHARGAAALGREPLLLPEVHPAQGRGDPLELPRGRGPARVDPADHRPRRHRRRRRAGSSRGCGSARRSASRARS